MARSTWSGTARNGVEVRPEEYRTPARVRVAGDVDLLCEKKNEGHQQVRTGERIRIDHKVVARAHCAAAGELGTAAAMAILRRGIYADLGNGREGKGGKGRGARGEEV